MRRGREKKRKEKEKSVRKSNNAERLGKVVPERKEEIKSRLVGDANHTQHTGGRGGHRGA